MTEQRQVYRDHDGVRRTLIWDDETPDQVTVHTEQDVEEIMGGIARDRDIMRHAHGGDKLAARIPLIVAEDLVQRGIYYNEVAFKAWLNSDEAKPFRIWQGQL